MGPTYKIAALLNISYRDAIAYCEEVRSFSGLGATLPYKTIANFLAQYINESPTPKMMAQLIIENKLRLPIYKQVKQKKPSNKLAKRTVPKRIRGRRKKIKPFDYERPKPPPSYIVRKSYLDRERVLEERLEHCPHGVPHGRICAICDPEKYREMVGFE